MIPVCNHVDIHRKVAILILIFEFQGDFYAFLGETLVALFRPIILKMFQTCSENWIFCEN